MMPFLLLILGLFLILLEFYLPGAIMATLGALSLLAAIVLFASQTHSLIALGLFILAAAISVILLIRFAMWQIKRAKPESSIYSDKSQEGYYAAHYDPTAIGKTGVVSTDLKPGGYVVIEGKTYPAISVSGYLAKGEQAVVIGGQEQNLLVRKKE